MRSLDDVEQRWSVLFNTSIGVDLRQAIREGADFDPCEEGLRSVCWRAFLLYGPLSKGSWTKKLAESRSAYASLRDHFLKYINNPDDLQSVSDPLADDESSPWSSLRQDEVSREEIFQDVTRCMQENYFFREPSTQRKMLDILFIYSKLNPDTGYRQGMHELLAPVLWVINQDAVDSTKASAKVRAKEGVDFMLDVLDKKYIEHDAFNLFCAVMQTAKSFYEMGESKDSSTIVAQSNRIHNELLAAVDPDLAHHLQVVGVLPQIYSIRWIRLLFGREFDFKDVLKTWDLLFAENLSIDIIDMTCVAMLLRIRWQLIEADYTIAITSLTRFSLPPSKGGPRSLVRDAAYLNRNRNPEAGATLVDQYTGRKPRVVASIQEKPTEPRPSRVNPHYKKISQSSPSRSPARFNTPQKQLESLFQEVSGNLQRRTEGWSVSKAVKGAVGEVRRNVGSLQAAHSRETSIDNDTAIVPAEAVRGVERRLQVLEQRNKALATMLDNALTSLRTCKMGNTENDKLDDVFNMALAKIQFVSVYLADADIPIPSEETDSPNIETKDNEPDEKSKPEIVVSSQNQERAATSHKTSTDQTDDSEKLSGLEDKNLDGESSEVIPKTSRHQSRPSLVNSSFSFMLGENRHRSSFVTSVSALPEQRRDSDSKSQQPKTLWTEEKGKQTRPKARPDHDGFTLNSFQ